MQRKRHIYTLIILMASLLPTQAMCQVTIDALHLPAEQCSGKDMTVTFGYRHTNTVVVGQQASTLGHSERIFLPDGVECGGSCSYRSPVTFTAFATDATITSVENIKYVRLNIEHSYIGDIYINITCPNGQKADLMRFAGTGTSSCDNTIPQESRNWLSGSNIGENTFFGMAYDNENSNYPCDPTATGNEPGSGWNYCWSSNSTSGYSYASGDGIIYRSGHEHGGHVDSSNVAQHTNFYHPDQHFSSLVGCPLNGTWYIEVVDGFSVDNGYIFEWELSLDAALIPNDCYPVLYDVEGIGTERLGDSTFRLEAPSGITGDSTINYRFIIVTNCGDTIDTTASVVYHPVYDTSLHVVVCDGEPYTLGPYVLDSSGHYDLPLSDINGCDSIVHLDLAHYPSYDFHFYDSTCLNVPYLFEDSIYRQQGVYRHHFYTIDGCDSLRTLHLGIVSPTLMAAMRIYPLIVDIEQLDIDLKDISRNYVASRWLIDGGSYEQREMTITYPVDRDSLPISLEATSREGCRDTATSIARIDRTTLFSPTVFSPSLDGNNRWTPVVNDVAEMEVWIYDRRGALVAHWEGTGESWDGEGCPQGVYIYTIHYRSLVRPDWKQVVTGTVTLIR